MKNGKMMLIGGIAIVLIVCAVFMFGGGSGMGTTTIFGNDYEKAQAALEKGEAEQAIMLLKKFTADNPNDDKAWVLLGNAYNANVSLGQPMGDGENAVAAYFEGYCLGNNTAQRMLAWDMYMYGNKNFGGGIGGRGVSVGARKIIQDKPALQDIGMGIKQMKLDLFDEILMLYRYNQRNPYVDILFSNVFLWMKYFPPKEEIDWDSRSAMDRLFLLTMEYNKELAQFSIESIRKDEWRDINEKTYAKMVQKHNLEDDIKLGIEANDPSAFAVNAVLAPFSDKYKSQITDDDSFTKLCIQLLEADLDKLDNVGKSILLRFYSKSLANSMDADSHSDKSWIEDKIPQIISVAEEVSTGLYSDINLSERVLSQIRLSQDEMDKIIAVIKKTKYENGKTWGDVLKKTEIISWTDIASDIGWRENQYIKGIARGVMLECKYKGNITRIFFPLFFNTTKQEWELVINHGALEVVEGNDYNSENIERMKSAFKTRVSNLFSFSVEDDPDRLTPWIKETLGLKK